MADHFAASRWNEWEGWRQLLGFFESDSQPLQLLDVGCGSGRLARFLNNKLPNQSIAYTGVDRNTQLLTIATQQAPSPSATFTTQFKQLDLVAALLDKTLGDTVQKISPKPPDIITLFAVTHHIPSNKLRQELLTTLADLLSPGGYLLISTWQFLNSVKLRERCVDPKSINLNDSDWDENDFILDWRSGKNPVYRYCHYTNAAEEMTWLKAMKLETITDFFADGETHNLNHYLVLKKHKK